MFRSARLKLTSWYLLIIMCISIAFSLVIYGFLMQEVERFSRMQRFRIEQRLQNEAFSPPDPYRALIISTDNELVEEIRNRVVMTLVIINGSIFVFAGLLGYILAGRTLKPIQEMMDEQNRFISDASHELRTPLTALKSALEVHLRDKHLTVSEAKTLIKGNLEDVNKLQSLSDALLQLAQYQHPNGNSVFEPVAFHEVIAKAVEKIEPLASVKRISLEVDSEDVSVMGNKFALQDLLIILLDNAIKYSQEGLSVSVNLSRHDGWAICTVKDAGIGIQKKDLPHVFDRFYRADVARSQANKPGYGLGLAIAKKIVDTHNGTISVESIPGKSTIFTIRLPGKTTV